MPHVSEFAFGASLFSGLSEAEIDELEKSLPYPVPEQMRANIPNQFRAFLRNANGLKLFGLSINGMYWRIEPVVGAPIGLHYGGLERPPNVPKFHFGFGSINGTGAASGKLFLTETGQVELIHRDIGVLGAAWGSFAEFLEQEIERQLTIRDTEGRLLLGYPALPGDTLEWETQSKPVEKTGRFW